MVYLLQKYFGATAARRPTGCAPPLRLGGYAAHARAFTRHAGLLSFFMFTYVTDRDGKMQLTAGAVGSTAVANRRFMLNEEAHHMFVARPASVAWCSAPETR